MVRSGEGSVNADNLVFYQRFELRDPQIPTLLIMQAISVHDAVMIQR